MPRSNLRVQDAILSAIFILVFPKTELAMRSVDASTRNPSSVVLDPEQMEFLGDTNDLQMTISLRFNLITNLGRIYEMRVDSTVESGYLPLS